MVDESDDSTAASESAASDEAASESAASDGAASESAASDGAASESAASDEAASDAPDYAAQVREAFPELDEIADDDLRAMVVEAWTLGLERGGWQDVYDIPYAWNIHEVSNVEHVRGVTKVALESAAVQREFHGADVDVDVVVAACLLHDVGKCYEYVDHVDAELLVDPDREHYATEEVPHSLSGYALAHEVGAPIAVQRAIPHFLGEVPTRTLEAELVKSANSASSNAITDAAMGITLKEWVAEYSQTQN